MIYFQQNSIKLRHDTVKPCNIVGQWTASKFCSDCLCLNQTAGPLCEWTIRTVDKWAEAETFEDYKRTLVLDCPENRPTINLTWTVPKISGQTVYYQVAHPVKLQSSRVSDTLISSSNFLFSVTRTTIWAGRSTWSARASERPAAVHHRRGCSSSVCSPFCFQRPGTGRRRRDLHFVN